MTGPTRQPSHDHGRLKVAVLDLGNLEQETGSDGGTFAFHFTQTHAHTQTRGFPKQAFPFQSRRRGGPFGRSLCEGAAPAIARRRSRRDEIQIFDTRDEDGIDDCINDRWKAGWLDLAILAANGQPCGSLHSGISRKTSPICPRPERYPALPCLK